MAGGNCPETPRQKMIGMMYLFYTALLALNVSGEILNAFVLVDASIKKTTSNFSMKTSSLYAKIDSKVAEQPGKYGALGVQAHKIETHTNKFFNDINRLKLLCMQASDPKVQSPDSTIKKMDDLNAAPGVMTAEGGKKMADSLRVWMEGYRDMLLGLNVFKDSEGKVDTTSSVYKNISSSLEIIDEKTAKGGVIRWEEKFSLHMPLIGTLALLSKLQADLRNVEAEVLEYMVAQLEGLDIRITSLEGLVSAPKSFVVRGGKYSSSIFLGARDTTMRPTVYVTSSPPYYDSTVVNGLVQYKLAGDISRYDTLALDETGKGRFERDCGSVGDFTYGGLVMYRSNRGDMWLPYTACYQVGDAGFTVSASKCNVLYKGLENPVDVSVSGYPKENVSVAISGGASIVRSGQGYIVTIPPSIAAKEVNISVAVKTESGTRSLGSAPFKVFNVPRPIILAGGSESSATKASLSANPYLTASLGSGFFPFDGVKYSVVSYDFIVSLRGSESLISVQGANFSSEVKNQISSKPVGSTITFANIKYSGPSGVGAAGSLAIKIK